MWDSALHSLFPKAIEFFAQCLIDILRHGNWSEHGALRRVVRLEHTAPAPLPLGALVPVGEPEPSATPSD